jgi:hypothetical protein
MRRIGNLNRTSHKQSLSGLGAGKNLRLTERFTRRDATTIDYRFTVEDPTTWTAPWSVGFPLLRSEELIYEYAPRSQLQP